LSAASNTAIGSSNSGSGLPIAGSIRNRPARGRSNRAELPISVKRGPEVIAGGSGVTEKRRRNVSTVVDACGVYQRGY